MFENQISLKKYGFLNLNVFDDEEQSDDEDSDDDIFDYFTRKIEPSRGDKSSL
jgi:hypothetical protein